MSVLRRRARRALLSAGAWHRDRLIERQAARVAADRAAELAAEPVEPAAVEPAPGLVAAPPPQPSEARRVVPDGRPWSV